MHIYRTKELAGMFGVHPNTVRLYETLGLIPQAERQSNGYRIFTELHIAQFRLARTAFQIEILQNGLRKKMIEIIKTSASGNFAKALTLTHDYLSQIQVEQQHAEEAIRLVQQLYAKSPEEASQKLKRKEVSQHLGISMDALRNWEMNGLLTVKRKENGYRVYTEEDIRRLKIIRSLRCANYSLEAILRMLSALSSNPDTDIKKALNTPKSNEEIIAVCDKLLTSLKTAETNAQAMIIMLQKMKEQFSKPPL